VSVARNDWEFHGLSLSEGSTTLLTVSITERRKMSINCEEMAGAESKGQQRVTLPRAALDSYSPGEEELTRHPDPGYHLEEPHD